MNNRVLYNDAIRRVSDTVRVVDENGEQVGVMSVNDGLDQAYRKQKDLVLVAERAKPPVAKIIEYGKYKYIQSKKQKAQQNNATEQKEIQFTLRTEEHDLKFKTNHIQKFIDSGKEVKVTIKLGRGRNQTPERAKEKLEMVLEYLKEDTYRKKKPVNDKGRDVFIIIEPNK